MVWARGCKINSARVKREEGRKRPLTPGSTFSGQKPEAKKW